MDESLNKKNIYVIALAALIIIVLALYWFLYARMAVSPPTVAPPTGQSSSGSALSPEHRMQILQQLPTETVPIVRRKNILQALIRK